MRRKLVDSGDDRAFCFGVAFEALGDRLSQVAHLFQRRFCNLFACFSGGTLHIGECSVAIAAAVNVIGSAIGAASNCLLSL